MSARSEDRRGREAGAEPALPRLSVVTPSYNQADFLEETLRSVLDQGYPGLEYFVVDGGSEDGSAAILGRYQDRLTGWTSGPDGGLYDALDKGFARTSGEVMGWLNADDLYLPGALEAVGEVFARFPQIEWLTTLHPAACDRESRRHRVRRLPGFHREAFERGEYVVGVNRVWSGWIPQESTFWRRSLWRRAGGRLDSGLEMAGDFELWARFFRHAELYGLERELAVFRRHAGQKTARDLPRYAAEARRVLDAHRGRGSGALRALTRMAITRLPAALRRPFLGLGLAYRTPVVRRRGGAWSLGTSIG